MRLAFSAAVVLVVALGCSRFDEASPGASATDAGADACGVDRPCGAGACVSGVCVADASPCKGLLAARPDLPSGVYEVSSSDGIRTRVYCDMTSFGGGLTLIGRSVAGGKGDFGWFVTAGKVDDDAAAYSLGLTGALEQLPFTEVFFGEAGSGKEWGAQVYLHLVPADFLSAFRSTATPPQGPATRQGPCDPPSESGPAMISMLGLTAARDHFFFSDKPTTSTFGLWPDGWDTNQAFTSASSLCSYGGAIGGKQGMIFVR